MKRMNRKNVYCKHGSSHSFLPRRSVDQSRLVIGIADLTHFVQHHFLVGRKMWRGWQAVYSLWTSVGISSRNCCRGRCGSRSEGINRSEHLRVIPRIHSWSKQCMLLSTLLTGFQLGISQFHQINLDHTGPIHLPDKVKLIEFPFYGIGQFHQMDFRNSVRWNWLESTIPSNGLSQFRQTELHSTREYRWKRFVRLWVMTTSPVPAMRSGSSSEKSLSSGAINIDNIIGPPPRGE